MGAEILSYSRSKGLFAGVSLAGATLRADNDANQRVYGRKLTAREIVLDNKVAVPKAGRHLVNVLQKHTPRNQSKEVSAR
jgi:lipid-binding SYLF domain-containing protein